MSAIRAKDTKAELLVRRALHAAGFRYRLHARDLPGRPDLVLPKFRAVILVHGCFWHGHGCAAFKVPSTRKEFWVAKIAANVGRDAVTTTRLHSDGWRVAVVWECALRGPRRLPIESVLAALADWLGGDSADLELSGAG